jgi:hypothetical protein
MGRKALAYFGRRAGERSTLNDTIARSSQESNSSSETTYLRGIGSGKIPAPSSYSNDQSTSVFPRLEPY